MLGVSKKERKRKNLKKVYLISNYFHFKQEKASNRYRELAEMLSAEKDLEIEVITSTFYQRIYEHRKNFGELVKDIPFKATFIEEPGYKKSISIKRLISSQIFAKNLLDYVKSCPKPDLIYQVVPTLDSAYIISKYAKENNIPLIIDVQDLWPEAFKMALNIPVISDIAFFPFKWKANKIYERADIICGVSETYVERALKVNNSKDKGRAVYIGINLKNFDKNVSEWNLKKEKRNLDRIKLAYCGSLSKSYDIKLVIDALALMKDPPLFIIMGGGNSKEEFEKYAKEKNVETIFTGFLPYTEMCGLLCSCDIVVNPIIGSSVASIINKHGDYAASGLPVINTQNSLEYCKLIEDYYMGYNSVQRTPEDLANKIEKLMRNKELRLEMGKNARKCAEEKFDRAQTYKKLVEAVKQLL